MSNRICIHNRVDNNDDFAYGFGFWGKVTLDNVVNVHLEEI